MAPGMLSPMDSMDSAQPLSSPSPFGGLISSDEWSLTSKLALASFGSQGTMGGLLVAGFVCSTVVFHSVLCCML